MIKKNKKVFLGLSTIALLTTVVPFCQTSCSTKQIIPKAIIDSIKFNRVENKKQSDLNLLNLNANYENDILFFNELRKIIKMHFVGSKKEIINLKNINVDYLKMSLKNYEFEFKLLQTKKYANINVNPDGSVILIFTLNFFNKKNKEKSLVSRDFKIIFEK